MNDAKIKNLLFIVGACFWLFYPGCSGCGEEGPGEDGQYERNAEEYGEPDGLDFSSDDQGGEMEEGGGIDASTDDASTDDLTQDDLALEAFPAWIEVFRRGAGSFNYIMSLEVTPDGGYITAGTISSGNYDILLLRLDPDGRVLWQKSYDGGESEVGVYIQKTSDGGYVVAALTGAESGGVDYDAAVLKLDPDGEIVWQKKYRTDDLDSPSCIQQTPEGGYVAAGQRGSFDDGGVFRVDLWILKLDADGNIEWENTYRSEGNNHYSVIRPASDGGYIVAGTETDGVTPDLGNWILKLDEMGNIAWQKVFPGQDISWRNDIQETSDGNYIMLGNLFEIIDVASSSVWLIKIDRNGNPLWQMAYGDVAPDSGYVWYDEPYSIQETSDGGFIVAGSTQSTQYRDACFIGWMLKMDFLGNLEWQNAYGEFGVPSCRNSYLYAARETPDGGYIAGGSMDEALSSYIVKTGPDGQVTPSCPLFLGRAYISVFRPSVMPEDTHALPTPSMTDVVTASFSLSGFSTTPDMVCGP